jgi:hypothetical protein
LPISSPAASEFLKWMARHTRTFWCFSSISLLATGHRNVHALRRQSLAAGESRVRDETFL